MIPQCDIEVPCSIRVLTNICLFHITFLFPGQRNMLANAAFGYIVIGIQIYSALCAAIMKQVMALYITIIIMYSVQDFQSKCEMNGGGQSACP